MRKASMKKRLMALLLSLTLVFTLASTAGASSYPGYGYGSVSIGIGQTTNLNSSFSATMGQGDYAGLFRLAYVAWESSDPRIVSVNANNSYFGTTTCSITGVSTGTATITATGYYTIGTSYYPTGEAIPVTQSWTVTVGNYYVPGVGTGTGTVTGNYSSLTAGSMSFASVNSSAQVLSVQSQYSVSVTWSSSNTSVAQVTSSSNNYTYVTPKGVGYTTITASVYSGGRLVDTLSCYVTVGYGGGTTVGGYKSNLSTSSLALAAPGQGTWNTTGQLTVTPASSWVSIKSVSWSSSDERVAKVTSYTTNGTTATVTAVANGTATISATVTFADGTTEGLGCNVTVGTGVTVGAAGSANGTYSTLSAGALTLGTTGSLTVGGANTTGSLYVTAKTGYTITNVIWTSNNTNVARVTPNYYTGTTYNIPTTATVSAAANGSTTVTAAVTVSSGYTTYTETLTCVVTVGTGTAAGSANGYYSTLSAGTLTLGTTGSLTVGGANTTGSLYVTAKTGYTIYSVTWTSSNTNVARVTPNYYTGTTYNVPTTATVSAAANGTATITANVTVMDSARRTYTDTLTCAVNVGTGTASGGISASVDLTERTFTLGSTNASTTMSIADQIASAVANSGVWGASAKTLSYVMFTNVTSTYGSLGAQLNTPYYYTSYSNPGYWYNSLSTVTFTPTGFAGTASFSYTAYATDNTVTTGVININVGQTSAAADVVYCLTSGQTKALNVSDFTSFWTKANNNSGTLSYIVLGTPTGNVGRMVYRNTAGQTVTGSNTPLYANPSYSQMGISSVSFAPNAVGSSYSTGTLTVPFTAYGTTGAYGAAVTKSGTLTIVVTKNAVSAVTAQVVSGKAVMKSSDFISVYKNATGTATTPVVTVQLLSLPAYGTLYSSYNAANKTGTAVTTSNYASMTFTSGTVNSYLTGTASSLDSLTYIPGASNRADSFRYALYVNGVLQYQGTVEIKAQITMNFTDVPTTHWAYSYVARLVGEGVVNGTTLTTFSPESEVKYGEALKMILVAAGYPKQEEISGANWAQNYITLAYNNGIINNKNVDQNKVITRNEVAEITAKALKLGSATKVNAGIVAPTDSNSGYVYALYNAGIVSGDNTSGRNMFYGGNGLKRSEVAKIVCNVSDYSSANN